MKKKDKAFGLPGADNRFPHEKPLTAFIDNAQAGYFFIDPEGCFRLVNGAWLAMHGYESPDEVIGRHFSITQMQPDIKAANATVTRLLSGRAIQTGEFTRRRKDGSIGYHTFSASPVRKKGKVIGLEGFLIDTTEQHRLTAELLRSKTFLEQTLEQSPAPMALVTMPGAVLTIVNSAYRTALGIADEPSRIGKSLFDIDMSFQYYTVSGAPVLRHDLPLARALDNQKTDGVEYRIVRKDRSELWVLASAAPIFNAGGEIVAAYLTLTDITGRRQAEENYRLLFTEMLDGFALHEMICTAEGHPVDYRYLAVNPAFERMTGLKAEAIIGRTVREILPGTEQYWIDNYGKVALTGEPAFFENYTDALKKHFEVTAFRPAPNQFACIFADITERKQTQDHLKKEHDLLSSITETSPVGITFVDRTGQIIFANRQAEKILGLSRDKITKQTYNAPVWRITDEKGGPFPEDKLPFQLVMTTGKPVYDARHAIVWPDGKRILLSINAAPLVDAEGHVDGMVAALEDITERQRTQDTLRESEAVFRRIFTESPIGAVLVGLDKKFLRANMAFCNFVGYSENELMGKQIGDITYPDDVEKGMPELKMLIEGKIETVTVQKRYLRPDKKVVWGEITISLVRGANNTPLYFLPIIQDITERKQAEAAIRESEEKFARAFEKAPMLMMITSIEDARIIDINEEVTKLSGFTREEAIGKTTVELGWITPEERIGLVRELTRTGSAEGREVEAIDKYGRKIHCLAYREIITIGGRQRLLTLAQDVTEKKRAEAERLRLEEQLRQSQKMEAIGRLAGGIAHDFNNILGVILGNAELALDRADPASSLYAELSEIRKAALRSADLTRQLLAFARRQTIAPRVLDINKTVENSLKMLRRLIGENVELAWHPAADLWPVLADPAQIDQILANLCVNARDAISGTGRISIKTENAFVTEVQCASHAGIEPNDYVLLAVTDNGCGMDPETLAGIFEPFFTTKEIGKGTGLGLATVYGTVQQNKGFLDVESQPGQGTAFRIYLPRHAGKVVLPPDSTSESTVRGKETILLVEDETPMLKMTSMMLERQGYRVLAAATPGKAIRLARTQPGQIDLLITDVVMPEMNGRDLAKNLLSLYPDIKRLFMSGYTADVIACQGVLDEGTNFIQKPFTKNDLISKVRNILDRK